MDKDYVGRDALDAAREQGLRRRLRCLVLDDPRSVALGNEPVRIGADLVGRVTSGGYGYSVARSIAYAYLPADVELGTGVELDIFGRWIPGQVVADPLFDPRGERIRPVTTRP
jgi:glycine cleavage system aminomethyltransferase T